MFLLQPKIKCEPHALMHGDEVKMGDTVLSFHIHPGTDTCDGCEPGQVMAHLSKYKREEKTGEPTLMSPSGENCMKSLLCFLLLKLFQKKKPFFYCACYLLLVWRYEKKRILECSVSSTIFLSRLLHLDGECKTNFLTLFRWQHPLPKHRYTIQKYAYWANWHIPGSVRECLTRFSHQMDCCSAKPFSCSPVTESLLCLSLCLRSKCCTRTINFVVITSVIDILSLFHWLIFKVMTEQITKLWQQ